MIATPRRCHGYLLSCLALFLITLAGNAAFAANEWAYDTPTQPYPRPAWIENVVMVCEPLWADKEATKLKPHLQMLKDAGFSLLMMYPDSFCRLYAETTTETWSSYCTTETRAAHVAGVKVLAGCYPFVGSRGPRDLLMAHPEWRLRKDDKVPEGPGEGCLVSPYGDAVGDLLASRVKQYDVDGFQFDGWYQVSFCRCPSCLKEYKKDTGLDVPAKFSYEDVNNLKYLVWRDKKLFDVFLRMQKKVKKVKPDAALINWNNNDTAGGFLSFMPESLNCAADWVNKEWWDAFDTQSIYIIKRLRSSSGDRPAGVQPYMFMRPNISNGSHGQSCPMEEVLYRMHKVMAMGSNPIIWPGARQGWNTADSVKMAQDYITYMPYITGTKTMKYAAVLDSYTSIQMARMDPSYTDALKHRAGVAAMLLEDQMPFDVVSEHNLTPEFLAQYKVLILPNFTCMSDRIVNLLKEYVAGGGGLVATYQTSLYDRLGNRLLNFSLADLFGANCADNTPLGPSVVGSSRIALADVKHPVTDDPALPNLLGPHGGTLYYGKYLQITTTTAIALPLSGIDMKKEADANEKAHKDWTPLVLSQPGKGRVAYYPAAIDAAYYEAAYPYERIVFNNSVKWAARQTAPVQVTAPKCVSSGFLTADGATTRTMIVHLLNETNSTTGRGSKDEKNFAIREEFVPISNVKVTFSGAKPERILLVPEQKLLEPEQTDGGWRATVPELALHSVVVAEYKK